MAMEIGARVPRRGSAFSRGLGRIVTRLMGWRIVGSIPDVPKMVMIGGPHTSNMDGVMAMVVLTTLGLRASTMIKDTAFKGLMGVVLRWFGAIPINRRSPKGVVEQSVDAFRNNAEFILLIAPEGTRSSAKELKRGFHHIALGAQVPIVAAAIDYRRKIVNFGLSLSPTSYAEDLEKLLRFYGSCSAPRHPERLSKPMADALGIEWRERKETD
jgi:1-acyl-sn-glycerol-3-phosphate acyltransferase